MVEVPESETVLRPGIYSYVLYLTLLGIPTILWTYAILHYGVSRGSFVVGIMVLPSMLAGVMLWILGLRVIIRADELIFVKWFVNRIRISREDIESVEEQSVIIVLRRNGEQTRIPIGLFPTESRLAIRAFLKDE